MAVGLGLTSEEWRDLRAQVDDSFWVMRVIGIYFSFRHRRYLNFKISCDQDILHCRMIMRVSHVVHTSKVPFLFLLWR